MGEIFVTNFPATSGRTSCFRLSCVCRIIMGHYVYVNVIVLPWVSLSSAIFSRMLCPMHGCPTRSGGGAMGREQKSTRQVKTHMLDLIYWSKFV